ncbi:MAG: hypothetical protein ABII64_10940 [Elusimicrobiota bacterium]
MAATCLFLLLGCADLRAEVRSLPISNAAAQINPSSGTAKNQVAEESKTSEIDIQADFMEYDEAQKYMTATGSVTVAWEGKVLTAKNVKFWMEEDRMYADTDVILRSTDSLMICDSMDYDFQASTGTLYNTSGIMEPWYFHSKKFLSVGENAFNAQSIRMTTCDLKKPHYYIRSNRAKVIMKEKVIVYNPVFYVQGVPVFYSPVYVSSLRGSKLSVEVQPGYNSEDGFILKTIIGYPLSEHSYGKLYIDYFSKRGWGKGAEYNYFIDNKVKASIYGYHIKEKTTENERWTMRGGYWQRLNLLWTAQLQLNYMSDTSFNSVYSLDNWERKDIQLNSHLSFTRQTSGSNLRLTTERQDNYDTTTNGFVMERLTIPRVDYTMYTKKGLFPFYTNFSAWIQNQYTKSNDYYLIDANADYNLTKDYRLTRKTTLTPRFGISEYWANRTSKTDFAPIFITRYYNDLNIRYRLLRWMDWDYGYNYKVRTAVNTIFPDTEASDYGEESKQVYFRNSMYLLRNMTLRNSTGYDFRVARNETVVDWREKLNPLVNELTWSPGRAMSIYVREESGLYPNHYLKSFQAMTQMGMPETRYLNLGFFYQSALPGQYDFNVGFGFWPTSKWKLDFNSRTSTLNNFAETRTTFYEAKLYRDLHCWEIGTTYRRVSEVIEVFFQIGLKASTETRKKIYNKQKEQEFYPWRE